MKNIETNPMNFCGVQNQLPESCCCGLRSLCLVPSYSV